MGAAKVYGCVEDDESRMYELWSDWVFRVAQTDILAHFNGDKFDMPYILCRLTGNKMRPMDSYVRPMRASRFPWMCVLWSIPIRPYWKRARARNKRSKGPVDDEEGELVESESEEENEETFEDVDNLVQVEEVPITREPDEEVTDRTQFDMIM